MTVLVTVRLTLSPCSPADAADFIDLERDPEVMRFLNGGHRASSVLGTEQDEVWYEMTRPGWKVK